MCKSQRSISISTKWALTEPVNQKYHILLKSGSVNGSFPGKLWYMCCLQVTSDSISLFHLKITLFNPLHTIAEYMRYNILNNMLIIQFSLIMTGEANPYALIHLHVLTKGPFSEKIPCGKCQETLQNNATWPSHIFGSCGTGAQGRKVKSWN